MPSTARRLLLGGALLAAAMALVPVVVVAGLALGSGTSTVGTLEFARELRIPPLLEPAADGTGRKVFHLRMQPGTSELVDGRRTAAWGFNGPHLGPTLRAARGDRLAMRVTNGLPHPLTVHWHGMHLPARADGGPHQMIAPGKTWTPSWTVDQPAATLWYHPHLHADTEDHVYRGLAGVHDARFEVLESGRGDPPPALRGMKDTVLVRPGETARLATRFSDYTDPAAPYMFHCHLLQHEDRGMIGQFVVVAPGDERARGAASRTPAGEPAASTRKTPHPSLARRRGDHDRHRQDGR